MIPRLVDAQKLSREHPGTFEVPGTDVITALRAGDSVKVCNGKDRFWVRLTAADGSDLRGVVSSPISSRRYGTGDTIQFRTKNVYDVRVSRTIRKGLLRAIQQL